MSNIPNPIVAAPQISDDEFDALFKAEEKRIAGDASESKRLGREFFQQEAPAPLPDVGNAPPVEDENNEASSTEATTTNTTTEAATDSAASVTDDTSTSNTTETQTATTAWLESLTPEVKAEVEKILAEKAKLEHRTKSDEGRVAAFQRHYETARREAEELRKRLVNPPPSQPASAAPPQQQQPKPNQTEIPAHIKAVMEYDEASGEALLEEHYARERELAALRNELNLRDQAFQTTNERLEELRLQQEVALLERDRPGATQLFSHPIWEDFKGNVPPSVRALAESDNRFEVMTALDEFQLWINDPRVKEWADKKYGAPQSSGAPATATTTTSPDPEQVARAQKAKQEAERKANAQPVTSGANSRPTAKATVTMDQIAADPKLHDKWHAQQFENELARIEGRKPRQV